MHWFDIGMTIALILSGVWGSSGAWSAPCCRSWGWQRLRYWPYAFMPLTSPRARTADHGRRGSRQAMAFALVFLAVMAVIMVCSRLLRLLSMLPVCH